MKYITGIVFLFFILTGCSDERTLQVDARRLQIDTSMQHAVSVFKGVWVLTEYIYQIKKTKSPLKSADVLTGIVTMIIDPDEIESDSFVVSASLNNHEGYSFTVYASNTRNKSNLKTNLIDYKNETSFYELGSEVIDKETVLFLYHYTQSHTLIDKQQFTKVSEQQQTNDVAWGIEKVINENLFAGRYLLIDTLNKETEINLNTDGSLTGFSNAENYYVFTDFMGGPETDLDGMCFNHGTKNTKCYAFKFKTDTLYLYTTKGDVQDGEQELLDKIQYKLIRK
jgi:hypothetical protein